MMQTAHPLGCTGHHSKKWMCNVGPPLGSAEAGEVGDGGGGLLRADRVFPGVLAALLTPPPPPLCLQLPHMPHISECLMKRSLKPTDLRDMTIGQLQVIVNDLHSQIESKWEIRLGWRTVRGGEAALWMQSFCGVSSLGCLCVCKVQDNHRTLSLFLSFSNCKTSGAFRIVQGSPWLRVLFKLLAPVTGHVFNTPLLVE